MNKPSHLVVNTPANLSSYWLAALVVLIGYLLPTIVAFMRGHDRKGAILFLNVIIGWTGLGWVYLMLMALELV